MSRKGEGMKIKRSMVAGGQKEEMKRHNIEDWEYLDSCAFFFFFLLILASGIIAAQYRFNK